MQATTTEAKFETARSHWKLLRLGGGSGSLSGALTSLSAAQHLWLRAGRKGQHVPGFWGSETSRALAQWNQRISGEPPALTTYVTHQWSRVVLAWGPKPVGASLLTHWLSAVDSTFSISSLCSDTSSWLAPVCHTSWENPKVRACYPMPMSGTLPPLPLLVKKRVVTLGPAPYTAPKALGVTLLVRPRGAQRRGLCKSYLFLSSYLLPKRLTVLGSRLKKHPPTTGR